MTLNLSWKPCALGWCLALIYWLSPHVTLLIWYFSFVKKKSFYFKVKYLEFLTQVSTF